MLVSRLDQPGLGAVTGYRWFTPARPTVANALVYSMNCDVMSLLTRSSHYLIWGGSWAIRRDVFDAIGLRDAWKGTLSDDLVASRLMRRSRLEVRFEPACVVASPLDISLGQAMSFIRRQYLVARLYTFDWWLFSFLAATFTNLIWLGNLAVLIWSLLTGSPSPWIPIAVSAVLYSVTVYRGCAAAGPGEDLLPALGEGLAAHPARSTFGPTRWWNSPIGSAWPARRSAAASTGAASATTCSRWPRHAISSASGADDEVADAENAACTKQADGQGIGDWGRVVRFSTALGWQLGLSVEFTCDTAPQSWPIIIPCHIFPSRTFKAERAGLRYTSPYPREYTREISPLQEYCGACIRPIFLRSVSRPLLRGQCTLGHQLVLCQSWIDG